MRSVLGIGAFDAGGGCPARWEYAYVCVCVCVCVLCVVVRRECFPLYRL